MRILSIGAAVAACYPRPAEGGGGVYYDAMARRCSAHLSDDLGRCSCTAIGLYAVRFDRDKPEELELLCGNHVRAYEDAGFDVRFLRRPRPWDPDD